MPTFKNLGALLTVMVDLKASHATFIVTHGTAEIAGS